MQGPIKPRGASKAKAPQARKPAGGQGWFGRLFLGRRLQQEYPATRYERKRERQAVRSNEHLQARNPCLKWHLRASH